MRPLRRTGSDLCVRSPTLPGLPTTPHSITPDTSNEGRGREREREREGEGEKEGGREREREGEGERNIERRRHQQPLS